MQKVSDHEKGIPLIVECLKKAFRACRVPQHETFAKDADYSNFTGVLSIELRKFCKKLDKPLIIFFDEADCLRGDTLITFLRQLREGYVVRQLAVFVHSVALVGMRNIRDYIGQVRPDRESLGSASPFNVSTET
jgi:hypothetical protein